MIYWQQIKFFVSSLWARVEMHQYAKEITISILQTTLEIRKAIKEAVLVVHEPINERDDLSTFLSKSLLS